MSTQQDRMWAARRRLLHGESTDYLAEAFGVTKGTIAQWADSHLDLLQSENGASVEDLLAFQSKRRALVQLSESDIERLYNRSSPTRLITNLEAWNGFMSALVAAPAMPAQNQLELAAQIVHREDSPMALLTERALQRFRLEVPPNALPYLVTASNPLNLRDTRTGHRSRDVVEYYDWNDVIQGQELPVPPALMPLQLEADGPGRSNASAAADALEYVLRRQNVDVRSAPRDAIGKPVVSWGQWPSVTGTVSEMTQLQAKAEAGERILRKPQIAVRWEVDQSVLVDELLSAFSTVWSAYSSSPSVVAIPDEQERAVLGYWPDPLVSEALKRALRATFGLTSENDRQPLVANVPLLPEQLSRLSAAAEVIQTVSSRIFALADGKVRTPAEAVNASLANNVEIRDYLKAHSEPLESARSLTKIEITEAMRNLRERRRRIEDAKEVLSGRRVSKIAHADQPGPGESTFVSPAAIVPGRQVGGAGSLESERGLSEEQAR